MKKLHDLLVLRITQLDKEKKRFPFVQIVGRGGIKWDTEVPVDKDELEKVGYRETSACVKESGGDNDWFIHFGCETEKIPGSG